MVSFFTEEEVRFLVYLLIVLILALAIAPILHFRPTRRQRLVTQLRDTALKYGLFVEFRKDNIFDKCNLSPNVDRADIIFYGLRIPLSVEMELKKEREVWLRDEEGWRNLDKNNEFPNSLSSLPRDVLAASFDIRCYGVYWTERGEVKDVEKISRILANWAACSD